MSDLRLVEFKIPTKAEKIPEVKELLERLKFYDLLDISSYNREKKGISAFQFYDSINGMDGMQDILDSLVPAKIPFDMWSESYLDDPEFHYMFREGMDNPFKYYGAEPSVPVDVLRDIIRNDPDYTREHLIEYIDAQFPEIQKLEYAVKDWEEKVSKQSNSR